MGVHNVRFRVLRSNDWVFARLNFSHIAPFARAKHRATFLFAAFHARAPSAPALCHVTWLSIVLSGRFAPL